MLHRIMTNNELEALNNKISSLESKSSQKDHQDNSIVHKKFNKLPFIFSGSSKHHSQGSCEILADQNSNSNSDVSSESTESSSGDQRTMDAADTLLSIANTPTTEYKAFLAASSQFSTSNVPVLQKKDFEICVDNQTRLDENTITLKELTQDLATESNDEHVSELEKQQFDSAIKLILERASKKFGSKMPSSITIKTTTTSLTNELSSTSINPDKTIICSENKSLASIEPVSTGNTLNTPELNFSSTPTNQSSKPTLNAIFESFSVSNNFMTLPQTSATSPSTSSSSLMFLSTGQAKKQKKFRVDADEFNFNPVNNASNNSLVICATKNEKMEIKIDPILKEYEKTVLPITTILAPTNSKIADEINGVKYENNYSDSESKTSTNSDEAKSNRIKNRLDSTSSTVSNFNDTNMSIGSMRQAPTLATGRRSKDVFLPPDEAKKRQERRERNKEAAARCRRKREDLTTNLTRQTEVLTIMQNGLKRKQQELLSEKIRLEKNLNSHEKSCPYSQSKNQTNITCANNVNNNLINCDNSVAQQQNFQSQQQQQQLIRIKKKDIDDIKKLSSEKVQQKLTVSLSPVNSGTATYSQDNFNKNYQSQASYLNSVSPINNSGSGLTLALPVQFDKVNMLNSPVESLNRLNFLNQKTVNHQQHQQNLSQMNHELFQQMLSNFESSKQQLTPLSSNSNNGESHFFTASKNNQQLKRPGNLELNKRTSAAMFSSGNNNELAKKIKEQNSNTAALYHIINSASNTSFNTPITSQYNPNRTPTISLNTPILNLGPLSFALTPLFDHPHTPHLLNTPNIERYKEQNNTESS